MCLYMEVICPNTVNTGTYAGVFYAVQENVFTKKCSLYKAEYLNETVGFFLHHSVGFQRVSSYMIIKICNRLLVYEATYFYLSLQYLQ